MGACVARDEDCRSLAIAVITVARKGPLPEQYLVDRNSPVSRIRLCRGVDRTGNFAGNAKVAHYRRVRAPLD